MKQRLAPRSFHFIVKEGHNEEFVFSIILMCFLLGNCRREMSVRKGLMVFVLLNAYGLYCNLRSYREKLSFEIAKLFIKETLLGPNFSVGIRGR